MKGTASSEMFTLHNSIDSPLGSHVNFQPQTHYAFGMDEENSVDVREFYNDGTVISHTEVSTEKGRSLWADYIDRGWERSR